MKNRKIIALLLAVLMIVSFAACKKDDSGETAGDKPAASVAPAKEWPEIPAGTVLQFWHAMGGANGDALQLVVDKFNTENPYGITVEATYQGGYTDLHTKVVASLQGGDIPNIAQAYANNIMVYLDSDAIVQLDEYIFDSQVGVEDFNDILQGYREENSNYPDGKYYSLPFNKSTEVLYYNETFFDANNLTVPTTWDELAEVSMAASNILGKPAFGYDSLANLFITWAQQAGSGYTNNEGDVLFNTPEAREALQFFIDGIEGGYFRTAGEDRYMSGPFNDENAVMFIGSTSGSAYIGSDTFKWNAAQVPFGKNKKVIQQGSNMFMLKSNEVEQLATFEFMKFLMAPENTALWAMNSGYLPVRASARELPEYVAFVEAGTNPTKEVGTSYDGSWYIYDPVFKASYSVRQAVDTAVEEAATGVKTVDQAITDAAASLE
ncbi:MAG: ABC transporter substrate-binding protein [Clostridiales bacterium]|nr:ABC transporter substrate-binding protein [Clostridiales bacterium]